MRAAEAMLVAAGSMEAVMEVMMEAEEAALAVTAKEEAAREDRRLWRERRCR